MASMTRASYNRPGRCPRLAAEVALVRYFAGARAAAGRSEETVPASSVDELISSVAATHGRHLADVMAASSFLVDGLVCRDHTTPIAADATVDVLPPFAGG